MKADMINRSPAAVFLSSSPCLLGEEKLNDANGFTDKLSEMLPSPCCCLFITSDRDNHPFTEGHGYAIKRSFEASGFEFSQYILLDGRNEEKAAGLIAGADLIILAGGHVPTQNRFFTYISLRELLNGFKGIIRGISAGSMNSAETVYVQPEEPGESITPDFIRFCPGLALCKAQILPHYNQVRDNCLDGRRLFEDITFGDSFGKRFTVLPDGSYVLCLNGEETVYGEAYSIQDGAIKKICENGNCITI
ncbi:MAG: dipeptidase E [Oscillospiraceae bacterium]|nr:dipeptidase E [Oscillospiraceae bacterium]